MIISAMSNSLCCFVGYWYFIFDFEEDGDRLEMSRKQTRTNRDAYPRYGHPGLAGKEQTGRVLLFLPYRERGKLDGGPQDWHKITRLLLVLYELYG